MVIKTNSFDVTLVGKNYYSYVMGLIFLGNGKKVCLLDDPRLQLGPTWTEMLNEMEKIYLLKLGQLQNYSPLQAIERYLKPSPMLLHFNQKRMRIGGEFFHNFQGILAKIPQIFSSKIGIGGREKANRAMEEYCHKVANILFEGQGKKDSLLMAGSLHEYLLSQEAFVELRELFDSFFLNWSGPMLSKVVLQQRNLIYLLQAFFIGKVSDEAEINQLGYLLAMLFSPWYKLDQRQFEADLHQLFLLHGGVFRSGRVEKFHCLKKRLHYLQLQSYEGLLVPGELYLMGHLQSEFPLNLAVTAPIYHSLQVKFRHPLRPFKSFLGERRIFSCTEKMGTTMPLWELNFLDESSCDLTLYYRKDQGDHLHYYQEKAKRILMRTLTDIFPYSMEMWNEGRMVLEEGNGLWRTSEECDVFSKQYLLEGNLEVVKNISYMGPLYPHSFGKISFLQQIRKKAENSGS